MRMCHKTDWVPRELDAYRRIVRRLRADGAEETEASRIARRMVERYGSHARRNVSREREAVR